MQETGNASRQILVVDDDEVMRELLSALLELQGYRTLLAASGESAVALLQHAGAPTLVLTDLQMPGLAGKQLAAALRQVAPAPTVLIAMSASQPAPEVLQLLDGFLLKPFESEDLAQAIAAAGTSTGKGDASLGMPVSRPVASIAKTAELTPSSTVLNENIFARLAESLRPDALRQIYAMTLDDVTQRYARIVELAAAGDLPSVRREAHAIKGACGFVGARELEALAAATEQSTSLNTVTISHFPAACLRLRNMLEGKIQTK